MQLVEQDASCKEGAGRRLRQGSQHRRPRKRLHIPTGRVPAPHVIEVVIHLPNPHADIYVATKLTEEACHLLLEDPPPRACNPDSMYTDIIYGFW